MKKYIIMELIIIPLIILALLIPTFVGWAVTTVPVTPLVETMYSDYIYVDGILEEKSKKDIIAELPIVPENIYFTVGDYVEINDVIADIDVDATSAALYNLTSLADIVPAEYIEAIGKLSIDPNEFLGYIPTEITAPASGTITAITLVEGAISRPKTTVVTIAKTDEMRVKMTVNELEADNVQLDDEVIFKASATGNETYIGKVSKVFPTASKTLVGTTQATVVGLYVTITSEHTRLKPGYSVTGVIKQNVEQTASIVPYEAIMQDNDNVEYVYTVVDSKLRRCNVKTGKELANGVQILSPPLQGQSIVADASKVKNPNGLIKIRAVR